MFCIGSESSGRCKRGRDGKRTISRRFHVRVPWLMGQLEYPEGIQHTMNELGSDTLFLTQMFLGWVHLLMRCDASKSSAFMLLRSFVGEANRVGDHIAHWIWDNLGREVPSFEPLENAFQGMVYEYMCDARADGGFEWTGFTAWASWEQYVEAEKRVLQLVVNALVANLEADAAIPSYYDGLYTHEHHRNLRFYTADGIDAIRIHVGRQIASKMRMNGAFLVYRWEAMLGKLEQEGGVGDTVVRGFKQRLYVANAFLDGKIDQIREERDEYLRGSCDAKRASDAMMFCVFLFFHDILMYVSLPGCPGSAGLCLMDENDRRRLGEHEKYVFRCGRVSRSALRRDGFPMFSTKRKIDTKDTEIQWVPLPPDEDSEPEDEEHEETRERWGYYV